MKGRATCISVGIFLIMAYAACLSGAVSCQPMGSEEGARLMGGVVTVPCQGTMTNCGPPATCTFVGGENNWCEQCKSNNRAFCSSGPSPPLLANDTCTMTTDNKNPVYCGTMWGYGDPTLKCSDPQCGNAQAQSCGGQMPNTVTASQFCP